MPGLEGKAGSCPSEKVNTMRKCLIFLLMSLLGLWGHAQAPKPAVAEGKVLVAFFSRTGNTRKIATMIHDDVGGDLFEIQTVAPYPGDYEAVKAQAMREQGSDFRPALKGKIVNFDTYRVIYLGYPIWWAKIPPPIASFLSEYSFSAPIRGAVLARPYRTSERSVRRPPFWRALPSGVGMRTMRTRRYRGGCRQSGWENETVRHLSHALLGGRED